MGSIVQWYRRQSEGVRTTILAGFFVLFAAIIAGTFQLISTSQSEGDIEIVDVSFGTSGESHQDYVSIESTNTLDIKIRNKGEKIAYLKEAIVNVEHIWELHTVTFYTAAVFQRGKYDISLPVKPTPYKMSVSLSQAIRPNDVDRFGLRLSFDRKSKGYDSDNDYIAKLRIAFLYDADARRITTDSILFAQHNGLQGYLSDGVLGPPLGGIIDDSAFSRAPNIEFKNKEDFSKLLTARQEYWYNMSKETINRNRRFIGELRRLAKANLKNEEVDLRLTALEKATETYVLILKESKKE